MNWAWDLWRANAPLALAAVMLLAGLGVPTPASLAIVATGALVRHGGTPLASAFAAALVASVAGSWISYGIARRGLGRWIEKKRQKPAWAKAVGRFERDAWTTIFLSRWLLTPLGLPVSYLAGCARYPNGKYLAATVVGSALWLALYGGLGYAFADQWESAAAQAKRYGVWIFFGLVALGAVAFLVRRRAKAQKIEA